MNSVYEKAQQIKLLICDVDGILTNGLLFYGNDEIEIKAFHSHDGLGIKLLQKVGIPVAIISGKTSNALIKRIQELDIAHAFLGKEDKLPSYIEIKNMLALNDNEIAYMGDDLPDLSILKRVGLSISVPQAPAFIKDHVDFITKKNAGKGAVREVCDLIIQAQGHTQTILNDFI